MDNQPVNVNPFRKYGALHNKGLTSLVDKLSGKSRDGLSLDLIIETVCDYLAVVTGQTTEADKAISYSMIADILSKTNKGDLGEKLRQAELGKDAIEMITSLLKFESDNVEEIKARIQQVENEVFAGEYNDKDKNFVLLALAIADASVDFWDKELQNADSFWRKLGKKVRRLPWKADVGGAVSAAVDPVSSIVFHVIPGGTALTITKIVGSAVVASAFSYITESGKLDNEDEQANLAKEKREWLKEAAKNAGNKPL
ncbi:hypothetical protein F0L74_09145 [Chitinophaga agrisoli]|uniref:Uncharacterized protein n=1 Tax=Chitinophaga agrisoli TaxID=2607653 RepID=A0A5B2VV85_9BACT|nr:hypothetical protein [Chitinophaga agrisoli]KAA2242684.1 hypothetical protein F0L74_09145 [Chitinophaga agrisoli]